jgi:hypothetical protein
LFGKTFNKNIFRSYLKGFHFLVFKNFSIKINKYIYIIKLKETLIMNINAILFICLVYIGSLNAEMQICGYEPNIDYYMSVDITYVYTKQASYCCTLCGLQPGCIGKLKLEKNIYKNNS